MSHRLIRRAAAAIALTALAACSSTSEPSPATASIAGVYHLSTINGQPLPFLIPNPPTGSVAVLADQITVNDGGTWSEELTMQVSAYGVTATVVNPDGGTWTRSGTSVTLTSTQHSGDYLTGTFTGSGFTLTSATGYSYILTR